MQTPDTTTQALNTLIYAARTARETALETQAMADSLKKDADKREIKAHEIIDFLSSNLPVKDAEAYKNELLNQLSPKKEEVKQPL